jgi:8-oxo-dGTP diphosphatase
MSDKAGGLLEGTLCLLLQEDPPRLLLGRKRTGFGKGKITAPGGKVEPNETPRRSAARELAEEVGVHVEADDLGHCARLVFLFPHKPDWSMVVHVFLSRRWAGEAVAGRELAPAWYPVDGLPFEEMWADDVHWLPRVLDGERIHGRFVFAADNETVERVDLRPWPPVGDEAAEDSRYA